MDTAEPTDIRNPRTTAWPRQKLLVGFVAFLLVGLFAGWHVSTWPIRLRYPGEIQHIEGIPLAEIHYLRQGGSLYAAASPERFTAALYGPLYFLLGAQMIDPAEPAYFPLRLVSLLATLGCAAGCAILAYWLDRSFLAAAMAPLLFLSYGFVTRYGVSARPDVVAVLLSFCGFLIAYRFQARRAMLLAVPFMLSAFFYKQHFVASPVAALLFLLLEKRYRLAGELTALLTLGGLGLGLFFQFVAFPGQAFLLHFLFYPVLPLTWGQAAHAALFMALVLLFPLAKSLQFVRARGNRFLTCYLGCAIPLNLIMATRKGSDSNYFLECVLLLSSVFPAVLAASITAPARTARLVGGLSLTLLLNLWFILPAPQPGDFSRDRAIQEYLRARFPPGTPALGYYTGDLLRAGLDTPISDFYHYGHLIRRGTLSDQDLITQLAERRFRVIVTYYDLRQDNVLSRADCPLTEPLRRALLRNYQIGGSLELPGPEVIMRGDRFYAWVPRPKQE